MSVVECPTCGATVAAEPGLCTECGSPIPVFDGVETRVRRYWSAPDLGLLAGGVLAVTGIVLLGAQVWLWAAVALALAALVLLLRWEAGRRRPGAAMARLARNAASSAPARAVSSSSFAFAASWPSSKPSEVVPIRSWGAQRTPGTQRRTTFSRERLRSTMWAAASS